MNKCPSDSNNRQSGPDRRTWYEIKNSASSSADGLPQTEVLLYDEIGGFGVSAARFIAELGQVPKENRLLLRIHSPGGSVLDGNAIFTALRNWPGGVTTHIDGLAASMASVIAIVGRPVQMASNGILMIHRVNAGAHGTPDDLRKMADTAEKIESTIVAAYVNKTGLSKRRITQMMDAETWMTATEAEEHGFIDEITSELAMAAKFDLSNFKNPPAFAPTAVDTANAAMTETISGGTSISTATTGTSLIADPLVTDLETKISELETQVTDLTAAAASHQTEIEDKESTIVDLNSEVKELTGKVAKLETEAKTADTRAREIAARNGANLPDKKAGDRITGTADDKQMSRKDFELLPAGQQRAFCRAGGKLTD